MAENAEAKEAPATDRSVEIEAALFQRTLGEQWGRRSRRRSEFVEDAILWLVWIPSSLVLIVLLLDDLMS